MTAAKPSLSSRRAQLALAISILAVLISITNFVFLGLSAREDSTMQEFLANVSLGMTMEDCRTLHGTPDEEYGPGVAITNSMFPIEGPRTDQGHVWIYYVYIPTGVMMYFDENGQCSRVRIVVT